ncbi:CAAX amino terminal protease family (Partial), partial [Seminavis robusta]|eukprot:Sro1439_g272750.1 CAAX amino terminal protease family (604) ;mRNA; r:2-1916
MTFPLTLLLPLLALLISPFASAFSSNGIPLNVQLQHSMNGGRRWRSDFASPANQRHLSVINTRRQRRDLVRIQSSEETSSWKEGESMAALVQRIRSMLTDTTQKVIQWCHRPFTQAQQWAILLVYYFFHLMVLSQHVILFPFQLIPNNKGHFCFLGWDSVAGMMFLAIFVALKKGSLFQKPWQQLIDHISTTSSVPSSPSPPSSSLQATTTSTTAETKQSKDKAEMDDIVSQVLEKLPRNVGLQRTKPASPDDTEKEEKFIEVLPGTRSSTTNSDKNSTQESKEQFTFPNVTAAATESSQPSQPTPTTPAAVPSLSSNASRTMLENDETTTAANTTTVLQQSDIAEVTNNNGTSFTPSAAATPTEDTSFTPFPRLDAISQQISDAVQQQFDNTMTFFANMSNSVNTNDNNNNTTKSITQQQQGGLGADLLANMTATDRRRIVTKGSVTLAIYLLVQTYFATARFSFFWEDTLYAMAGVGFPMTVAMHRSLCVLLGHLTWVGVGSAILGIVPRPRFFGRTTKWYRQTSSWNNGSDSSSGSTNNNDDDTSATTTTTRKKNNTWIWWVIGGYSVSAWFFNMADFVNLYTLPQQVLEEAILQEGVVTQ